MSRRANPFQRGLGTAGHALPSFCALWLSIVCSTAPAKAEPPPTAAAIDFDHQIAPILVRRCLGCHNASERSGGLLLETRGGLMQGGDSGPAFDDSQPGASLLLARVEAGEMPPPVEDKPTPMPTSEIELIRAWVKGGAVWSAARALSPYEFGTEKRAGLDWWSLQPVNRVDPPSVSTTDRVTNPVDRFVLARLEAAGLSLAPRAERRTIIRRLYEDLIGLPPTYEEIEAFAADESPGAYDALVDRLLASPHFGERWGRFWLDLARFADTCGYERDQEKPHAWRYRDWVIDAINRDLPFDDFVRQQLAGDELPDASEQTVIATGFLRLGAWNDEPNDPLEYKYERLDDLIHTTTTAFLGLTVRCARCHDHKFDPIRQTDYYRIAAVFWAGHVEPREAALLGGPNRDELGYDVLGYTDRSPAPPPLQLLRKGDPARPEQEVAPGYLSCVGALDRAMSPPPDDAKTSHRRRQLAEWIVDPQNPLTARVAVNRLWQHHFGAGLVRTPDNVGFAGDRPTHPQLLDWLAHELVAGGWRMKRMHKLLVMSETYRQSSIHPRHADLAVQDADNQLWWHARRRRLDAEALRDALLSVAGQLDPAVGGPSFRPDISPEALEGLSRKNAAGQPSPPEQQRRRSVYMFSQRSLLAPLMTVFDFCDTTQPCAQRDVTIVAPQALALLNNAFAHQMSAALAERAMSTDDNAAIVRLWQLALGRRPSDTERAAAHEHLLTQTRHYQTATSSEQSNNSRRLALLSLSHVLLNCNEFLYVD
ncbi:MAG: PSD1 and planctomycete cytochrome C domain-containing protein [Pirellulales bacterium]|nr:PSD1 and planctomycete cytochrome C domain-containing protein [Pirellulales bacterium]